MALHPFLQSWLRSVAGQRVRETLLDAARQRLAGSPDEGPDAQPPWQRPCDVAVVFALETESGGLEDKLEGAVTYQGQGFVVRLGALKGHRVAVVRSGAGGKAAAAATEAVLAGHQPAWVISSGFAGGLTDAVGRHDLLIADHVVDTAGNELKLEIQIDSEALAGLPRVHVGRLVSADRVVRLPDEKRSLGRTFQALAVDMETFGVAEVCLRRRVPFLAVRVIVDAVGDRLPPDVDYLLRQKSLGARLGAAFGALMKRPGSLKDLMKLKEQALIATDRLAEFLTVLIQAVAQAGRFSEKV